MSIKPNPEKTVLVPGGTYTVDITTTVERGGLLKEDKIPNPYLDITIDSDSPDTAATITGVASREGDYGIVQRDTVTQSLSISTDEFSAGSLNRVLLRVQVPENASSVTLSVEAGRGSGTPDVTVTNTYTATTDRASWEALAASAEARSRTAAKLNDGYDAMVDGRSLDNIIDRGMRTTFLTAVNFGKSLLVGAALGTLPAVGSGRILSHLPAIGQLADSLKTANEYRKYANSLESDEKFDGPWIGSASRAQMRMVENGFTTIELNRVETAGNTSFILSRIEDLSEEEAEAWRNHNRERALDKLRRQREYLTATDSYEQIDDLRTPPTLAENVDSDGESLTQTEAGLGGKFNLYTAALSQENTAKDGPRTGFSNERAFENAALYFQGVRKFSTRTEGSIQRTISTTQRPTPSVTLTNRAEVRTQLASTGTVQATFRVSNDGGPTTIHGFLSLTYSDETLELRRIEQVDEESDGEVLRNTVYDPQNRSKYVNDTLTNTYEPGTERVLTRGGDRKYVDRSVTDVFERFAAGETNTYRVTFERSGPVSEPAEIGYRTAFQPLVHESGQSAFVRAPTQETPGTQTGVQEWAIYTVNDSGTSSAPFDLEIVDTNAPITAGEPLEITGRIENNGTETATSSVVLSVADIGTASASVRLAAGEATERTFTVQTSKSDEGENRVELVSPSDATSATVRIKSTQPDLAGEGTETNPFVVTNARQLQAIQNDLDAYYVLGNDINASETTRWNGGSGFDPIVQNPTYGDSKFTGTLDGRGHTITGLTIDRPWTNYVGLFAWVGSDGTVKNVVLRDVDIRGEGIKGSIAGRNDGRIRRAGATGSLGGPHGRGGGLVGTNHGTITESFASVSVSGEDTLGGLVGGNYGTISESYATGSVSGYYYLGGLAGYNRGNITESYATAHVSSHGDSGGFVGSNGGSSSTTDGYWSVNATGMGHSANGTALTTAEMTGDTAVETMVGFDFGTAWQIRSDDPPALAWQDIETNTPPMATADRYSTVTERTLSVSAPGVLSDDTDEDGNSLAVVETTTPPSNGTVTLVRNGSFRYTPEDGFTGQDSFTYRVSDGAGASDTAVVAIDVTAGARTVDGDEDGDNDYATIGAALEAADGGRITVEPGTYAEQLTVEDNVTLVAPNGATLNGTGFDSAAAITIPVGSAATPSIAGFRIQNYTTGVAAGGAPSVSGSEGTAGSWVLRNVTIVGSDRYAVDASQTTGDWTLDEVRIRESGRGVKAAEATGAWLIRDSKITATDTYAVAAYQSEGDWTIRNSTARADAGVSAGRSAGDWTVLGSQIYGGLDAEVSDGNWTVRYSLVAGGSIDARKTDGNWSVRSSVVRNSVYGVVAKYVSGDWVIDQSAFVDISGNDISAYFARTAGDATNNWWGSNGRSCTGNVDCSNPLSNPPAFLPDNERPLVRIDTPSEPTETNVTVTLDASNSTDPDGRLRSLEWDVDDDGSYERTGTTIEWSRSTPGTYTVGLRATDSMGGTNTTATTIAVVDELPPSITDLNKNVSSADVRVTRVGFSVRAHDDDAVSEYRWDFDGDGTIDARTNTSKTTHTYAELGDVSPTITVVDTTGHTATSTFQPVNVADETAPSPAISGSSSAVVDVETAFSAANSTDNSQIVEYRWDFDGDGRTDETTVTATTSHTYTEPGKSYTVSVTAVDRGNNTASASIRVRVRANTRPDLETTVLTKRNNVGSPVRIRAAANDENDAVRSIAVSYRGRVRENVSCAVGNCSVTLSTSPEQSTWNEANETYGTSPMTLRATDSYGASVSKTVHVRVYVAGDTNGDGTVNIFDAVELGRNWQTRRGDESYSAAADLNNDGVVNIFDAVVIGRNWRDSGD